MLSKTSVDEVFMHHFEKMSSASAGFARKPLPGSCPWTLLGDFRPLDPSLPTPGKNPAGAHAPYD